MRTNLTSEDIKNLVDIAYNGGQNEENIVLIDDEGQKEVPISNYLGITFYAYKERVEDYDGWLQSINASFNKSYGLVEVADEEVTASQDIDAGTKLAQVTILMQADKVKNLEYYHNKVKNYYLGNPQQITNAFGGKVTAYLLFGALTYQDEPIMTQIGECVVVSFSLQISYLGNAGTYADYKISISLDGDDEYDENGDIVGTTKFLQMPITQATFADVFGDNAVTTYDRPDMTGFVISSVSQATTISFYDFNVLLAQKFDEIFWGTPAYRINGILSTPKEINIPVFVRVEKGENSFVYKDVITSMQKQLVNNDFITNSVTFKGFGKIIT